MWEKSIRNAIYGNWWSWTVDISERELGLPKYVCDPRLVIFLVLFSVSVKVKVIRLTQKMYKAEMSGI